MQYQNTMTSVPLSRIQPVSASSFSLSTPKENQVLIFLLLLLVLLYSSLVSATGSVINLQWLQSFVSASSVIYTTSLSRRWGFIPLKKERFLRREGRSEGRVGTGGVWITVIGGLGIYALHGGFCCFFTKVSHQHCLGSRWLSHSGRGLSAKG